MGVFALALTVSSLSAQQRKVEAEGDLVWSDEFEDLSEGVYCLSIKHDDTLDYWKFIKE